MPIPIITTQLQFHDAKGESVAHVTIDYRHGVLWLTDVWTHADYRRKGYARQLITEALALWPERIVYLEVLPYTDQPLDSAELEAFYREFGFSCTDIPGIMRRG